jgi:hypothetical protein
MNKVFAAVFLLTGVAWSCQDDENINNNVIADTITGEWLFFEYGYSPGAGYETVAVSPVPPRTIRFEKDMSVVSNIENFSSVRFYRILEDTTHHTTVLALFEDDPGSQPVDIRGLTNSYSVYKEGDTIRLSYRWCIEGCHMAFRKIRAPDDGR